jgi:hypothetical protein
MNQGRGQIKLCVLQLQESVELRNAGDMNRYPQKMLHCSRKGSPFRIPAGYRLSRQPRITVQNLPGRMDEDDLCRVNTGETFPRLNTL